MLCWCPRLWRPRTCSRCAGHRQETGARELSTLAMHIKTVEGATDENVFFPMAEHLRSLRL